MAVKRNEPDDGVEFDGGSGPAQAVAEAHLTRPAGHDVRSDRSPEDRMSLFWRVFGGTILSIAALAAVTMYNAVTSNVSELRSELARTQAELNRANADLRGELNRVHESRADTVKGTDFAARLATVWDGIKTIQAQNAAQNAQLASLKTDQDALKERGLKAVADAELARKDLGAAVDALKKDQSATTDALKKDIASLDVFKDRLGAVVLDLKAVQTEAGQARQQLDRNQAYDQERKESRDKQYKLFDELIKELQKGMQDCREKLARLEGAAAPPAPAKGPKGEK